MTAVYYVVDGPEDGPVVLLSNPIGGAADIWREQVEPLVRNGFRVIRYDTRGHGRSPVPPGPYRIGDLGGDALALLDELSVDQAHVAGVSLGGQVSMWLAARHPDRVRGLVVCCSSAKPGNTPMWTERAAQARAEGLDGIADATLHRWFTGAWLVANPERAKEVRDMVAAASVEGYVACCALLGGLDLTGDLAAITAPTLVIAGAEDPALPPAHSEAIAAAIPGARLEVIDNAAHMAAIEQPDQVSELIIGHLKDVA